MDLNRVLNQNKHIGCAVKMRKKQKKVYLRSVNRKITS